MTRAMTFIDGTWLYSNTGTLAENYGDPSFRVDYGRLQDVLTEVVRETFGGLPVDAVRTHLFGSYAENHSPEDHDLVKRRLDFFAHLERDLHFEVETYGIDYRQRRVRRQDRDPDDDFIPREKCVDIALASALVHMAAADAYDIAIVVAGDRDFIPALQRVRRLGKRVVLASIAGSCAQDLADPYDRSRVKDADVIWLDDMLERIKVRQEKHKLACQSPHHVGPREVWTQFHPRRGQRFTCGECRARYAGRPSITAGDSASPSHEAPARLVQPSVPAGHQTEGRVSNVRLDKRFAFVRSDSQEDFFIHESDLAEGVSLEMLAVGTIVRFQVSETPGTSGPAGRGSDVAPCAAAAVHGVA